MQPAPPYHPPQAPLEIIYHDDAILLIDKPAGLLSVPGRNPEHKDSVAIRAAQDFEGARIVHRLDMDTSGVMLLALTADAHRDLSRQFEARKTDKTYIAEVAGAPIEDEGAIDAPLICDWPNRPRQKVDWDNGKPALTHWRVIERGKTHSRIALKPKTGRSHQLRVHMAHLGHPILGDPFYAPAPLKEAAPRLMLHAQDLAFTHPYNGERMSFHTAPPF